MIENCEPFSCGKKYNYPLMDFLKFFCSLLVVTIHVPIFSSFGGEYKWLDFWISHYVARIAVPFYFACAGYFLYKKIDIGRIDWSIIRDYVFKLLRLQSTWLMILFVGHTNQFWFLPALIIAVLFLTPILYFFDKYDCIKIGFIIALSLYIIGLLGDSYYGVLNCFSAYSVSVSKVIKTYEFFFGITRNGIFMGVPFLFIGFLLARYKIKIGNRFTVVGLCTSFILMGIEAFLLRYFRIARDYNMYFFLLPTIFFLMYMVLNKSVNGASETFCKSIRNIGIIVYFNHLFVLWFFVQYGQYWMCNSAVLFLCCLLSSILLGIVIVVVSNTGKFKVLSSIFRKFFFDPNFLPSFTPFQPAGVSLKVVDSG